MTASTFIQIVAACAGVIGSLFFAIGVMRQTVSTMADLSGTYFDWNPHMIAALAAQKADYLFGGGIIVLAFTLQLTSFLVPSRIGIPFSSSGAVPWIAALTTVATFLILRCFSLRLAGRYESKIRARLREKEEEDKRAQEERRKATRSAGSSNGA